MPTYSRAAAVLLSAALLGGGASAFEGPPVSKRDPAETAEPTSGRRAFLAGDKFSSVSSLLDAAERGHVVAQWKLARMYAEGDGVERDDVKAFDYFSQVAAAMPNDDDLTPADSRMIREATSALGRYYLHGVPNSPIRRDLARARHLFEYSGQQGDPDAQYNYARMLLEGEGGPKSSWQGIRYLGAAANKGQREAQALLGNMLFNGIEIPRQSARGLMWLRLAKAASGANDRWIDELYRKALASASEADQEKAEEYVAAWNKDRD